MVVAIIMMYLLEGHGKTNDRGFHHVKWHGQRQTSHATSNQQSTLNVEEHVSQDGFQPGGVSGQIRENDGPENTQEENGGHGLEGSHQQE